MIGAEAAGLMTLREDLAVPATFGEQIWDESQGTEFDGVLTEVTAPYEGMHLGTFWGSVKDNDIENNGALQNEARALARKKVERTCRDD